VFKNRLGVLKMYKCIILAFVVLLSLNANADWSASAGEVTRVYSHNGSHVIRTTITDQVCGAGNFWWPANDEDAKDMFSIALAALMAGKKIMVVYDTSDLQCNHGNSAKITHMSVAR
jgi:hypothetical protein